MRVKEENAKAGLKLNNIKKKLDHGIQSHHFVANRKGKVETVTDFIFVSSKSLWTVTATKKLKAKQNKQTKKKTLDSWKENYDRLRQHIKKQGHYFADKSLYSQSYGFSSSHVWMWSLDHKEGWALKNWCVWTVLEKTLESPLDCKKIKLVNPKGNQLRIFIGRIMKLQYFGHSNTAKSWLLEKTRMLEKIEDRKRRGWNRMKCLDTNTNSVDMSLSKLWETVKNRESWNAAVHGVAKSQIWLTL